MCDDEAGYIDPELTPLLYLDPDTGTTNSPAKPKFSAQDPWLQDDESSASSETKSLLLFSCKGMNRGGCDSTRIAYRSLYCNLTVQFVVHRFLKFPLMVEVRCLVDRVSAHESKGKHSKSLWRSWRARTASGGRSTRWPRTM